MTGSVTPHEEPSSSSSMLSARPLRVLHVINQLCGRAGAERSLEDILVRTHGAELHHGVCVLRIGDNRFGRVQDVGIATYEPERAEQGRIHSVMHVRRAIRAFAPDLVHTSLAEADIVGRIAARVAGVPAVSSIVNTPYVPEARESTDVATWKLRVHEGLDGILSRHATLAFHAITRAAADAAVTSLRISEELITVVPRGRDADLLGIRSEARRRRVRTTLGLADATPVLVQIAREEPQKAHRHSLACLARVRERYPDAVLLIVGRAGRSTEEIVRLIGELQLEGAVRRLGWREDAADIVAASDVFLFPSLYEGLGGAVLEAMAIGTPVVATDTPAVREVLDGGRCGRLVPVGDVDGLAAAACEALGNSRASAERSRAGRARFQQHYRLERCLEGMERFYADLLPELGDGPSRLPGRV